jgi:hypothetical protein
MMPLLPAASALRHGRARFAGQVAAFLYNVATFRRLRVTEQMTR